MSVKDNKAIVRRYLDELCAPSFKVNGVAGLAEIKRAIFEARRAFPDICDTIEEMIAEGDTVVCRWTITGIAIVRLADGRIVEHRFEAGAPSFKEQVGSK